MARNIHLTTDICAGIFIKSRTEAGWLSNNPDEAGIKLGILGPNRIWLVESNSDCFRYGYRKKKIQAMAEILLMIITIIRKSKLIKDSLDWQFWGAHDFIWVTCTLALSLISGDLPLWRMQPLELCNRHLDIVSPKSYTQAAPYRYRQWRTEQKCCPGWGWLTAREVLGSQSRVWQRRGSALPGRHRQRDP